MPHARASRLRIVCGTALAAFLAACGSPPAEEVAADADAVAALSDDPRIGRRVHITGCENGQLVVPVVNLWDSPARTSVIGKLSGDGRADQGLSCQGAVVIIRDVRDDVYQVESVVGDQIGWVTEPFIGRTFDTSTCDAFFSDAPEAAQKCAS